mmetsp:Transcript_8985/g.18119  ORF Transcript_8985/g.18119 Transcript_8985/m.18119 type:complete len:130 (+) Transcript_8985:1462-1851(+)
MVGQQVAVQQALFGRSRKGATPFRQAMRRTDPGSRGLVRCLVDYMEHHKESDEQIAKEMSVYILAALKSSDVVMAKYLAETVPKAVGALYSLRGWTMSAFDSSLDMKGSIHFAGVPTYRVALDLQPERL